MTPVEREKETKDACTPHAFILGPGNVGFALVRISSGTIVRLANHGGIAIRRGVLLRGVHVWVHDGVGALGTLGETTLTASDGTSSTVAAAWGSVLVLASCRLSLTYGQHRTVRGCERT